MDQPEALTPQACYGLACPRRGQCARFEALTAADGMAIESCQTREGWPLYLPRALAERSAARIAELEEEAAVWEERARHLGWRE